MPVHTETLVPLEVYEQHPLRAHHCRNMEMGMSQFISPYCVQSNFRVVSWEVACTFLNKKHPGINILVAFSSWHVFFFLSLSLQWNRCAMFEIYLIYWCEKILEFERKSRHKYNFSWIGSCAKFSGSPLSYI